MSGCKFMAMVSIGSLKPPGLLHRLSVACNKNKANCCNSNTFTFWTSKRCLYTAHFLLQKKGLGSSSNQWLERQRRDPFIKQAGKENYRCRSAFKLIQINEKYNILKPGHVVIDCGAAPGSWCQVAIQCVNPSTTKQTQVSYQAEVRDRDTEPTEGMVIGIDLTPIAPIDGTLLLGGCDFTSSTTQQKIKDLLKGRRTDVVLSDMAPRATGIKAHNHTLIIDLCFEVLRFSLAVLRPGGTLVCKIWDGERAPKLEAAMKTVFENVKRVKPDASRDDSAEMFMVGRGFKYSGKSAKKQVIGTPG